MIAHHSQSIAILVSVFCALSQACASAQASSNVILEVEIEKQVPLAKEIPFTVILSAKKDPEVTTLETATLEFRLERLTPGATPGVMKRSISGHAVLDNTKAFVTRFPGGQDLIERVILPRRKVTLSAGQQLRRALQLSEVFQRRYGPGEYVLTAKYEDNAVAEARFKIVIYKESVPALIDLIEKGDFESKVWARNTLFIIAGQPAWSPSTTEGLEKIKSEVQKLRSWWVENKPSLKLQNGQFVPTEGN